MMVNGMRQMVGETDDQFKDRVEAKLVELEARLARLEQGTVDVADDLADVAKVVSNTAEKIKEAGNGG